MKEETINLNMLREGYKKPPVEEGQLLIITPVGKSRDPFVKFHGYVIFIKQVPEDKEDMLMQIQMTSVRQNCGFAIFIKTM